MKSQKKIGAVLLYSNLVITMLSNLILVPIMIRLLSDTEYSLYKIMQSFSAPLLMFNLGISTITARCIAKYKPGEELKKENSLATILLVTFSVTGVVILLGFVLSMLIPSIYGRNYSETYIQIARVVFLIFVFNTAIHILTDFFRGCVNGHERFVFSSGLKPIQLLVRFFGILLMLYLGLGIVAIALVDLCISALLLLVYSTYNQRVLHERFRLYKIERAELIEMATFSFAILLQALINQANSNVDIMILGATETNKEVITMYSSALAIFSIYNSVVAMLSNLYLPSATRLIEKQHTSKELTDFVIKPGRIQAMIAMAIICGFFLFGKAFITMWIGAQYIDAYYVALIIMIPVTIPLVQNICLTILDAQLKRLFRSVILIVMAIINVVVSLILIQLIGFWGAALGTAISFIIGHGIIMNIYYQKKIHLDVWYMFRGIFKGTLPAALVATLCCLPFLVINSSNLWMFLTGCATFMILYFSMMWMFGFNREEKELVRGILSQCLRRRDV